MAKMRIYEIAKMYGVDAKKIVAEAQKAGFEVKSHMSSIEDYQFDHVKQKLQLKAQGLPVEPEKVEKIAETASPVLEKDRDLNLEATKRFTEDREGAKVSEQRIRSKVIRRRRLNSPDEPGDGGDEFENTRAELEVSSRTPERKFQDQLDGNQTPGTAEDSPYANEITNRQLAARTDEIQDENMQIGVSVQDVMITRPVGTTNEGDLSATKIDEGREVRIKGKKGDFTYTFQHLKVIEQAPVVEEAKEEKKLAGKTVEVAIPAKTTDANLRKAKFEEERPNRRKTFKRNVVIERDHLTELDEHDIKISGRRKKRREFKKTEITVPKAIKRIIKVDENIQVGELAKRMGVKVGEIITKLVGLGAMATVNQSIDIETATLIAGEYNFEVENVTPDETKMISQGETELSNMKPKPPVVTVMGHVDHGKTSILDAIRKTSVAAGEAGGITQHIGAYVTEVHGQKVTFIDTPGHEAFTMMRARGAQVTDIVVLVTAADDGVMPQTIEAINHAKAAGVPIIVAINKIDMPQANIDRVRKQLAEHALLPEDWGGDTLFVEVSAREHIGIETLLESILLQAEIMELKADAEGSGVGIVIETRLDKAMGQVMSLIVKTGCFNVGDIVVCGNCYGKIRALVDDKGDKLDRALPAQPVEVLGISGQLQVGDVLNVVKDEKIAKQLVELRKSKDMKLESSGSPKVSLDGLFQQIKDMDLKELNLIVKSDTNGTADALRDAFHKLSTEDVKVKVINHSAGGITGNDVMMASAFNAIIIGFNVRPDTKAQVLAGVEQVELKLFSTIYDAIDLVKNAMRGLLVPTMEEELLGKAEVRQTFTVPKIGTIAGCYIIDGKILRNCNIRLIRDNVVIYDGKIRSLRRFKDDVREVSTGFECGIGIENYNDLKEGDVLESYMIKEVLPDMVSRKQDR